MAEPLFLIRIELLGVTPQIWRRFFVPATIRLDHFHYVIREVMGWYCEHLYEFIVGKERLHFTPFSEDDGLDPSEHSLIDVVSRKGQVIHYSYDMGDNWEYKLKLEDSCYSPIEEDARSIVCLGGARACPPEDIGGIYGYYQFCETVSDPKSPDYEEMKEWYAEVFDTKEPYDCERFDLVAVNKRLATLPFAKRKKGRRK